jgi:hypothetical protein
LRYELGYHHVCKRRLDDCSVAAGREPVHRCGSHASQKLSCRKLCAKHRDST